MATIIAMGNIKSDGTILRATPGITISEGHYDFPPGNFHVNFPPGFVYDSNYIVQLTSENVYFDGDYHPTTIGLMYQSESGFDIKIWGAEESSSNYGVNSYVAVNWHFVVYDIN